MGWSVESLLRCVVENPDKARRFFAGTDLDEVRAELAEASRLPRPDRDRAVRAAALLVLGGELAPADREPVAAAVAAAPRTVEPALVPILLALPHETRVAVLAGWEPERARRVVALADGDAHRALVLAATEVGVLGAGSLARAFHGRAELDDLLWALAGRSTGKLGSEFLCVPRPIGARWVPRLASAYVGEVLFPVDPANRDFTPEAWKLLHETVATSIRTSDDLALAWLEEVSPETAAVVRARLAAAGDPEAREREAAAALLAPPDPRWRSGWLGDRFPEGVDRAAFVAWAGPCAPVRDGVGEALADLVGPDGEYVGSHLVTTTWGCAPLGTDVAAVEHDWEDLAVALHVAQTLERETALRGICEESDGTEPWAAFVATVSEPTAPALAALLGLPGGALAGATDPRLRLEPRGLEEAPDLVELLHRATAGVDRYDASDEWVQAPVIVAGRVGRYLAGVWSLRTWT